MLTFTKRATPSSPVANKKRTFYDIADNKLKTIDENGVVSSLELDGWRDRPIIYNGSFEFWQRQVPATATTYSSVGGRVYTADRWCISCENASITAARVDTETAKETGLSTRFYGAFTKITTTGKMLVGQVMGATSIMNLRGNRVRLQFNLRSLASLNFKIALIQLAAAGTVDTVPISAGTFITAWGANGVNPTLGTNLAYIAPVANSADGGTLDATSMLCPVTTSWKRFSCTFDVPNDCHNLALVVFSDSQLTAAQVLYISEAGLYEGAEIRTNFVPYASILEFLRIQKYYANTFQGVAPAQNAGLIGALNGICSLAGAVALAGRIWWRLDVPLRIAPAAGNITLYNPSAANALMRMPYVAAPADMGVTAVTANLADHSIEIAATGVATTLVGSVVAIHAAVDVEL